MLKLDNRYYQLFLKRQILAYLNLGEKEKGGGAKKTDYAISKPYLTVSPETLRFLSFLL